MNARGEGTDYGAQIFMLESVQNIPLGMIVFTLEDAPLYFLVYKVLYSLIDVSPRFYIAILSFIYFSIVILSIERIASKYEFVRIRKNKLSALALFSCLCFSPSFICIARFHFAVIILLLGLLTFIFARNHANRVLGLLLMLTAYYAHEGIVIIYALVLLSGFLYVFWLSKSRHQRLRNIWICLVSVVLFIIGPKIFSIATTIMGSHGLLNERYIDSYAQGDAGDGSYLLVLVLSLFGSMLSLFMTSLFDRKNNWITSICISGLFLMCLFFNQKFFYVQRIFMFIPLFIGLSCMQVLENEKNKSKRQFFVFFLLSVPSIYLCQLVIENRLFFGG